MKLISPLESLHPNTRQLVHKKKPISIEGAYNLPIDLIIEILSRLPVKTLCKFRCVSKQWLYLLSRDKSFIARHCKESKKTALLLSRKYSSGEKEEEGDQADKVNIELTSMAMEGNVINKVKASICGPIYTFTSCGPLVVLCCTDRAYVFNPGSQEFVPLPRTASVFTSFNVGFGYSCSSNEYKIVHLFTLDPFNSDQPMGCEVFTLRDGEGANSGAWKRVQDCAYKVHTNCSAICVGGYLYWKITEQGNESSSEAILSFDLEREEFRVINYPKCYIDSDQKVLFLTGFRGSLCLVDCYSTTKSTLEMWLLKGNGQNSSWVKRYSTNISGLDAKIEIKGLVPTNDEDGEILMNTEQNGLVYYNPEKKVFQRVENSGNLEWYKKPCLYYDSFFCLHSK